MCSARVLANHFDEVVVLERGRYLESPQPRQHVPQGVQPRVLPARGATTLCGIFPDGGSPLEPCDGTCLDFCHGEGASPTCEGENQACYDSTTTVRLDE